MQSISIKINTLKAALLASPKDDIRYYLDGVFLDKAGYVVATNGHYMFVKQEPFILDSDIIIPNRFLEFALKLRNKNDITASIGIDDNNIKIYGITFEKIDGKYPNWRKIIPKHKPSGVLASFMPQYVALASKVLNLSNGCKKPRNLYQINHDGPDNIGSAFGEEGAYFGVMPTRDNHRSSHIPSEFLSLDMENPDSAE